MRQITVTAVTTKKYDGWCNEGFCSLVLDGMPGKDFIPKAFFINFSATVWYLKSIKYFNRTFFSKISAKNASKIYPKNIKLYAEEDCRMHSTEFTE